MDTTKRNPLIRVHPHTRKKLKLLAAHYEESMQDTVERLAQAEMERLEKGGESDVPRSAREPRHKPTTR